MTAEEEAFGEALGQLQTKGSAEANLAQGKHVEHSVRGLRPSSRSHMLGFGGYGSGWRTRPARGLYQLAIADDRRDRHHT
jgi:hypothetical protein